MTQAGLAAKPAADSGEVYGHSTSNCHDRSSLNQKITLKRGGELLPHDRSNVCSKKNTRTSTFTKKRGMSTKSSKKEKHPWQTEVGRWAEKHCHTYLANKPSAGPAPGADTLASGDKITGPARTSSRGYKSINGRRKSSSLALQRKNGWRAPGCKFICPPCSPHTCGWSRDSRIRLPRWRTQCVWYRTWRNKTISVIWKQSK